VARTSDPIGEMKNDKVCKWCKKELLYDHLGVFCNFCRNQKIAKVATLLALSVTSRLRAANKVTAK